MCVLFQSVLMFTRHHISMMVYCKPTFIPDDFISLFTGDKLVRGDYFRNLTLSTLVLIKHPYA